MFSLIWALLTLYSWIIFIRAVVSWVQPNPRNPIVELLHRMTEPVLRPIRRFLPPSRMGGIDVSPAVAIVLIWCLKYVLRQL